MTVSCFINPSNAFVNQNVTFSANASGGSGYYTYSWSGSDGITGSGQTFTGMFSYPGSKYATVTVYSNGQSATASCNTNVQGGAVNGATVIRDTTAGTPVAGVFLSQVPATGIDAANLKMILFVVGLFAWSLFAAYIISFKRKAKLASANGFTNTASATSDRDNTIARINAFKEANMKKKGLIA
jgi:hypothetical protein